MAAEFAKTSEATRLKVGALLVKDDHIISQGVNGTPKGWIDNVCEGLDGLTLGHVRHAEINCLNKLRRSPNTSTGATMFITHAPCLPCSIDIVDAGVKQVYYREQYRDDAGLKYLEEKGIDVVKM